MSLRRSHMPDISYPAFVYILRSEFRSGAELWKVGACRRTDEAYIAVEALAKRLRTIGKLPRRLGDGEPLLWSLHAGWGIRGQGLRASKLAVMLEAILLGEVAKSYKMWVACNRRGVKPYMKLRSTDYAKHATHEHAKAWMRAAERAFKRNLRKSAGLPSSDRMERLPLEVISAVNLSIRRRRKKTT